MKLIILSKHIKHHSGICLKKSLFSQGKVHLLFSQFKEDFNVILSQAGSGGAKGQEPDVQSLLIFFTFVW